MDLRAARKLANLTQEELEEQTGIAQADISRFESGVRLMGESVAQRLARHLPGTTPSELLLSNKTQAFKKAQERSDKVGVLKAAESIVKHAEGLPSDPQLDALLDRLVKTAVNFSQTPQEPVYYNDPDEGRDVLGRRVEKARGVHDGGEHWDADYDDTYENFVPGKNDVVLDVTGEDEEDYDDFDDGRDIHGIRVRPLGEVD